jgi:hypothetical protein
MEGRGGGRGWDRYACALYDERTAMAVGLKRPMATNKRTTSTTIEASPVFTNLGGRFWGRRKGCRERKGKAFAS